MSEIDKLNQFLSELKGDDKNQVELLDAYFASRSPKPEKGYIQENRTTQDIIDDMNPMMPLSMQLVVKYMFAHGYSPVPTGGGTVTWAIWHSLDIG